MVDAAKITSFNSNASLGNIRSVQIRTAYKYWRSICDEGRFPSRKDIDPINLRTLLPYVMLIDVPDDVHSMKFRLIGSAIIDFIGFNPTGKLLTNHLLNDQSPHLLEGYYHLVKEKGCHYLEDALFTSNSESIRYHRLICPLASDGKNIDCIFGVVCFDRLS